MASFKRILINTIKNNSKTRTREYFEAVCAKWNLNGWLTDDEVKEVIVVLDEVYK